MYVYIYIYIYIHTYLHIHTQAYLAKIKRGCDWTPQTIPTSFLLRPISVLTLWISEGLTQAHS